MPTPSRPSTAVPPRPAPTISDAELNAAVPKLRAQIDALAADVAELQSQYTTDKRPRAEAATTQSRLATLREQLGPNSPHYRQALYNEAKQRVATGKASDLGDAINDLEREMGS